MKIADMKVTELINEVGSGTPAPGGGAVAVTMNGKKEVLAITIKPEAVDPDDVEMLSDMVVAAVNAAMKSAEEDSEKTMGKLTGGINMPGLF